jgi:hypothetical protein
MARTWARVAEEVAGGRQAYVVCPRIGDDDAADEGSDLRAEAADDDGEAPTTPARPLEEFDQDSIGPTTHNMRAGGGGARSLIVCCALEFDEPAVHPLTQLMPEVLVLRRADANDPALPTLLSLMAAEVAAQRVGAATMMARLADKKVSELPVIIKADSTIQYQKVVDVLDMVGRLEITQLGLVTQRIVK